MNRIRRLLAAISLALAPLAATSGEEGATAQSRAVVQALFAAFNAQDLEAIVDLYHPQVVKISPDHPLPRRGKEVIRENYAAIFRTLPGVEDTVQRILSEWDCVAVEFTASWPARDEAGQARTKTVRLAAFLRLEDGKIIEDVTYYNPNDFTHFPAPKAQRPVAGG